MLRIISFDQKWSFKRIPKARYNYKIIPNATQVIILKLITMILILFLKKMIKTAIIYYDLQFKLEIAFEHCDFNLFSRRMNVIFINYRFKLKFKSSCVILGLAILKTKIKIIVLLYGRLYVETH